MVNKVTLIGRLGSDPEVRRLENGVAVAKLNVATNDNYKDKTTGEWVEQTEWHSVVAWRYLAERAEQYLKKGRLVYIEGKLTTRKWQDQEGKDRYNTEVVASTLRMLDKREDGGGGYRSNFPTAENAPPPPRTESSNPTPDTTVANTTSATGAANETTEVAEDDLPF